MINFYASPTGNGNGLAYQTPASLIGVKALVQANTTTDAITVNLLGGRYDLSEGGLVFGVADAVNPVTWQPATGETPRFSGGVPVAGWTLHDAQLNIYVAETPVGFKARQFYVDNVRANRAHYRGGSFGATGEATGLYLSALEMPMPTNGDVEFITGGPAWTTHHVVATSVIESPFPLSGNYYFALSPNASHVSNWISEPVYDGEGELISEGGWGGYNAWNNVTRIENSYVFLTEPGDFYLDHAAGKLYYIPLPSQAMALAECYLPKAEKLLSSTVEDRPSNITFTGIVFEHAAWNRVDELGVLLSPALNIYVGPESNWLWPIVNGLMDIYPSVFIGAAVHFAASSGLTFTRNTVRHCGGMGVCFDVGTQDAEISYNRVHDISATGILIGNTKWFTRECPQADRTLNVSVNHNRVYNIAYEYMGGAGILGAGSGINMQYKYNTIYDTPYGGLYVVPWCLSSGYSTDHEIAYNRIYDTMTVLGDGGAIYTRDVVPGRIIHDNYLSRHNAGGNSLGNEPLMYSDNETHICEYYRNVCLNGTADPNVNTAWLKLNGIGDDPTNPYHASMGLDAIVPVIAHDNYSDLSPDYYLSYPYQGTLPVQVDAPLPIDATAQAIMAAAGDGMVSAVVTVPTFSLRTRLTPPVVAGEVIVPGVTDALIVVPTFLLHTTFTPPTVTGTMISAGSIRGPDGSVLDLRDIHGQPITYI